MMCPKTLRIGNLPHGGSYMIQEFLNFDPDVLQVLLALLVQKYEFMTQEFLSFDPDVLQAR